MLTTTREGERVCRAALWKQRIIWGSFAGAIIALTAIVHLRQIDPGHKLDLPLFPFIFIGLISLVVSAVVARYGRSADYIRTQLYKRKAGFARVPDALARLPESDSRTYRALKATFVPFIIACVFCEFAAVIGFLASFMMARPDYMHPFAVTALLVHIANLPMLIDAGRSESNLVSGN